MPERYRAAILTDTKLVMWRTKEEVEWPTLLRELADDLEKRENAERENWDDCSDPLGSIKPEEVSSFVDATEMQMLLDFLDYTSKQNESRSSDSTTPSPKPGVMLDLEKFLSSVTERMAANGLSFSTSKTSSTSIERAGCPTHYQKKGFTTDDLIAEFLNNLYRSFYIKNDPVPVDDFYLGAMVKYLSRAGEKGPWQRDAFKAADYFHKVLTGVYLNEVLDGN